MSKSTKWAQNRQNQLSTKNQANNAFLNEMITDIVQEFPKPESKTNEVLVKIEETNKIYTDQTGRFQISSQGNQYIHIAYVYDINAIIATPIKSRTGGAILEAHKNVIEKLERRGFKPKTHWLDNEASA